MALSKDAPRVYELEDYNDLPVKASTKIYEGAYVGITSGYARGITSGDAFGGIAVRQADNSLVAVDGNINVRVKKKGCLVAAVTGVTAATNVGSTVYASADDTLTLSSTGGVAVGRIIRHISGTTCAIEFEAAGVRSV